MARKKNTKEAVVENQVIEQSTQPVETPSVEDENQETETSPKEDENQEAVLPKAIDKLLRCYPNYTALYVDSKGGVYPDGTQPNLVEDAILYQNPYYKS